MPLLPLLLAVAFLAACEGASPFTFRVGIAVGNTGQCSEMEDAHRGHKLFADKVAQDAHPLFLKDREGNQHRILFDYTRYNDDCESEKHNTLVRKLIEEDKVHFMLGSTPVFAEAESMIANEAQRLMYHCCVGPDLLYEKDMKFVFGAQASNTKYPQDVLKRMALEAAVEYAGGVLSPLNPDFEIIKYYKYNSTEAQADPRFYENIANDAIDMQADGIMGCDFAGPGDTVTKTLHSSGYYYKALWLTVAPAKAGFVESVGAEAAENVLTAGQWHPAMKYADTFYGTTQDYVADFEEAFGLVPSYVAAGASAVSYSLAMAIQDAFSLCRFLNYDVEAVLFDQSALECVDVEDKPLNTTGYQLVLKALAKEELPTFFGVIAFNQYRRNIAKDTATTQIQNGKLEAVLPLEYANRGLVLPRPPPGSAADDRIGILQKDEFVAVVVVVIGSVLLFSIVIAVVFMKGGSRNRHSAMLKRQLVLSADDLIIIAPPVRTHDGGWEEGRALYRSALVALAPLTEVKVAEQALVSKLSLRQPDPSSAIVNISKMSQGSKLSEAFEDDPGSPPVRDRGRLAPFKSTSFASSGGRAAPFKSTSFGSSSGGRAAPYKNQSSESLAHPQEFDIESPAHRNARVLNLHSSKHSAPIDAPTGQPICEGRQSAEDFHSGSLVAPATNDNFMTAVTDNRRSLDSRRSIDRRDSIPHMLQNLLRIRMQFEVQDLQEIQIQDEASAHECNLFATMSGLSSVGTTAAAPLSQKELLQLLWRCKLLQHPSIVPITGVLWSLPSEVCDIDPATPILVSECQALGPLSSVMSNQTLELDPVKVIDIIKVSLKLSAALRLALTPYVLSRGDALKLDCPASHTHRAKIRVPLTSLLGALEMDKTPCCDVGCSPQQTSSEKKQDTLVSKNSSLNIEELHDVQQFGLKMACLLAYEPACGMNQNTILHHTSRTCTAQMMGDTILAREQYDTLASKYGENLAELVASCCSEDSKLRPTFSQLFYDLEDLGPEMIKQSQQVYRQLRPRTSVTQSPADALLYEFVPVPVADALKEGKVPEPELYKCVSLLFSDIVGYTEICSKLSSSEVLDMLHRLYSGFDNLLEELELFKVGTVGDGYICCGNLKVPQPDTHAAVLAQFAFGCLAIAKDELICLNRPELGSVRIRVGLHVGPVTGAVVGTMNRRFSLFGDTVNVTSRMESTGIPGKIQCSAPFIRLLQQQWPESKKLAIAQGPRSIKGKGLMNTFYLFPSEEIASNHQNAQMPPASNEIQSSQPPKQDVGSLGQASKERQLPHQDARSSRVRFTPSTGEVSGSQVPLTV